MWMGAIGGVTISLKGVYDHGSPSNPWSDAYNLWHIGRPLSGAIAGLITAVLFMLVVSPEKLSPLVLYGVAFIFGTQDRAFFDFLSTFASRFLPTKQRGAPRPPFGSIRRFRVKGRLSRGKPSPTRISTVTAGSARTRRHHHCQQERFQRGAGR